MGMIKMKVLVTLIAIGFFSVASVAQQFQTQTAPLVSENAKILNGTSAGYAPTKGALLTLNISSGRVRCVNTMTNYAGGTLAMTNSTTNYVFLDTASSCAPGTNTTGYTASLIPIATVVAAGGVITTITDDRTLGMGTASGSGTGVTTTGSPLNGQMTKFSGPATITTATATDLEATRIATTSGSANAYVLALSPAITTYTGYCGEFISNFANTGAATLNISGLGAKNITKNGATATALAANDIKSGQTVSVCYDGTQLEMQSPSGNASAGGTVTTTGSPANGNLTCFSGATLITNCDLSGDGTTSGSSVFTLGTNFKRRGIPFSIGAPGGSALTVASTTTDYMPVPFACTISAYTLLIDAGTITVKFWKVATGTAIPTSGNSISTSGVGISTGTAIHSTTVSDFTTTTVTKDDIMAMNVTAVATAAYVQGLLECDQ